MVKLLKLERISKSFGGLKVLKNINMSVEEGEIVAIIGPNGAGKTTLFNIINGIYRPDSGRIIYQNIDITKYPPYRRAHLGISRAFQIPRPFPNMNVMDNIVVGALFARKDLNLNEAKAEAERILRALGLYEKRYEEPYNLTSPELKLLELARALATKPRLLLLDEIVAGMPPSDVDRIMELVRKVAIEEKISVVAMVEHVIKAVKYSDRVLFLHQGEILLEGAPDDILNSELVKKIYLGEAVYA